MWTLEDFIEQTQACGSEVELFRQFDSFVRSYGIDVSSYHVLAENLRAVPIESGLIRQTFPDDWARKYISQHYSNIDPVLEQSRREARPFHWFDVDKKLNLSTAQKQFLTELKQAGLTDGIAVPVFGPMGTIAYFGLGSIGDTLKLTEEQELELQFACLQTHNRHFELAHIDSSEPRKPLSPREKQVLSLVAAGLSNICIADRLGITENTVDTMMRRAFTKLGVNNRISAVLKGIGCGLILP